MTGVATLCQSASCVTKRPATWAEVMKASSLHETSEENSPLLLNQTTLANFTLNPSWFSVGNKVT